MSAENPTDPKDVFSKNVENAQEEALEMNKGIDEAKAAEEKVGREAALAEQARQDAENSQKEATALLEKMQGGNTANAESVQKETQGAESVEKALANAWEEFGIDKDTAEKLLLTDELTSTGREADWNDESYKKEYQTKVIDNRLLQRKIEEGLLNRFREGSISDEEKNLFLKSITKHTDVVHWAAHLGSSDEKLLNNEEVLRAVANSGRSDNKEWAQKRAKELGFNL